MIKLDSKEYSCKINKLKLDVKLRVKRIALGNVESLLLTEIIITE